MNQADRAKARNSLKGHKGHLTRAIKAVQRQVDFMNTLQVIPEVSYELLRREGDDCREQRDKSVELLRALQEGHPEEYENYDGQLDEIENDYTAIEQLIATTMAARVQPPPAPPAPAPAPAAGGGGRPKVNEVLKPFVLKREHNPN